MPPSRPLVLALALAACYATGAGADDPRLNPYSPGKPEKKSTDKNKVAVPPSLRIDYQLTLPPPGIRELTADKVEGLAGSHVVAEGQAVLKDSERQIESPWMRYDEPEDLATTHGKVVITKPHDRLTGHNLKLKIAENLGELHGVHYELTPEKGGLPGRGQALKVLFQGKDKYRFEQVTYSTCKVPAEGWELKASELELDYTTSEGRAKAVQLEYKDVPILYAPWLDFSLDSSRKSGLLPATYGLSQKNGLDLMVPWYWNIAPEYDATLVPRYLSKRGLQLGGEFRYLQPSFKGEVWADYLSDSETGMRRYQYMLHHQQQFGSGWSGNILIERVSDDNYFTDLSSHVQLTSKTQLPGEGRLRYQGDSWAGGMIVQGFQTLGNDPLLKQYERMPELYVNTSQKHLFDTPLRFDGSVDLTLFNHPLDYKTTGTRTDLYPSLSLPLTSGYGYLTPKIGYRVTRYDLDPNGEPQNKSQTRALPVFSLDGGLYMERDWTIGSLDMLQTLEPRAYYLRIPNHRQDTIPLFDSGLQDISLAQLFSENQYSGIDRINDADQVTLGMTSRFVEAKTGVERLQMTLAQRFYFRDQTVTLNNADVLRTARNSDLLAAVSGPVNQQLRLTGGMRYDNANGNFMQGNLGGQYSLSPGKRVNFDFRYIKGDANSGADPLRSVDLSYQWPLRPQIYGVGRINYDFASQRLTEGLLGFEYNPGCWTLRGAIQQLATSHQNSGVTNPNLQTNRIFFIQLELTGLTQLGSNPLDTLKRSITGFVKSEEINE